MTRTMLKLLNLSEFDFLICKVGLKHALQSCWAIERLHI